MKKVQVFDVVKSPCRGCVREWESKNEGDCQECQEIIEFQKKQFYGSSIGGISSLYLFRLEPGVTTGGGGRRILPRWVCY